MPCFILIISSAMDLRPQQTFAPLTEVELAEMDLARSPKKPLELFRDTERSLRGKTVATLALILPTPAAMTLGEFSLQADESLQVLAKIDLDEITDTDLKPARIAIGLIFTGFGSLMMMFLLLYLSSLQPQLGAIAQIRHYWYEYVWFVSLGVTGLTLLAREAMRPEADN